MTKVAFGEYGAFTSPSGIRFQKDNKMIGKDKLPPEVVSFLTNKLEGAPRNKPVPKFPMPTEEEKARLKAESMKVPDELKLTPEEEAMREAPREEPTDEEIEAVASSANSINTSALGEPIDREVVDSDFMEQVSIHTASLEDMVEALYNRFGIYTVHLRQMPNADEINPLTGERFSKYHLGIAYQAAIRAQTQGILDRPAELGRASIDAGREAHKSFQDQFEPAPTTMGEARRANSFAYRTSSRGSKQVPTTEVVHEMGADGKMHAVQRQISEDRIETTVNGARSVRHPDEEEPILQPKIGGAKIIRPDW